MQSLQGLLNGVYDSDHQCCFPLASGEGSLVLTSDAGALLLTSGMGARLMTLKNRNLC